MAVLGRSAISDRMKRSDYLTRLLVTPLLSEDQIGQASIDIRLGSSLLIPKKSYVEKQDVTDKSRIREIEKRLYERVRLKYKSKFMLHPNQLILGVSFEYLSLPRDVSCTIMSRSSWGRLGLVVATAAMVQPGYKGCITLELVNLSESPIALYPGLSVGQLVFHEVPIKAPEEQMYQMYKGRYQCPTEAEAPKFFTSDADLEMEFWGEEKGDGTSPQ